MEPSTQAKDVLAQIKAPLRWTLAGLWLQAILQALWPLNTVMLAGYAALAFGLPNLLPLDYAWFALLAFIAAIVAAMWFAAQQFQRPTGTDALARLDAGLSGQPLAALRDDQAIGADDPASVAVWQAHLARMARKLAGLRAAKPDLRLSSADPFALRYGALLIATLAVLFGPPLQMTGLSPLGTAAPPSGPMWEAWATPPAYTGQPALYLADQKENTLTLPIGTRIDLRLYGAVGDVILDETVSARTDATTLAQPSQSFALAQSGALNFRGTGGRDFAITALPDAPPSIAATGPIARQGDARFTLPFTARDDYGIAKGRAEIALDISKVTRTFGLAAEPDAPPTAIVDLPLPRRGERSEVTGELVDDLSKDLLSNLPVTITLQATDGAGQTAAADPVAATLPGKRFFDPLAAAIVEMRRDILWARSNAPRAAQILKAVTSAPEGFIVNNRAYLRLRAVIAALEGEAGDLTDDLRGTLTEEMWQIAVLIEEGDLASARERLTRAQDRLDEAIRKGASPEEIDALMQELQDALRNYTRQLAQEQRERGEDTSQNQDGPSMNADQLQQMLDKLKELIEQGKTAEAAELMQRLREFMDNMRVAEGEGQGEGQGQGQGGPSGQAMRELGDTMRGQQGLSDDAFRDMQNGGDGNSQSDQGEGTLAQRQQALRDRLEELQRQGNLPGEGSAQGEAGRQALDDAARAMEEAEQALRDGDLPGALDGQAQALQALREGMQQLGEALAQEQGEGQQGERFGAATGEDDPRGRDPLGREAGNALRNGSDENLLQGGDVYRRAEELLDEIRRRSGEGARPEDERNYLKRLLDLF
jgi:uncharacterized protein (TIGR02302 family)